MTEVLPDPTEAFFAQDPTILREPERTARVEGTRRSPVVPVAIGLGGAYLAYRTHMIQRLHQELQNLGPRITQHALLTLASGIWNVFVPQWISMTAPYLAQGYMIGARAARAGTVPDDVLKQIAEGYAEQLGMHINDVSAKAMASGFQAQVNRKAPPQLAARRVADAYGVPRKTMNSLVNIWESDEAKKLTDIPLPSAKEQRAKYVIETQNALRARQVGDTESWAAYTQGKQLVWMYGQQHGTIPKYARRVWITAHDERVCPVCGPMDGVAAPIGKKFPTSDGEYWTPPAHINCRCEVVLDLSPDKDADESLRALLQAEAVSKARPGDPYDRDEGGRFASSERRKVRGKPVAVKVTPKVELEGIQLPTKIPSKVEEEQGIDFTGYAESDFDAPDLSAPDLSAPDLSAPDLSGSGISHQGASLHAQLVQGIMSGINLDVSIDPSALMAKPLSITEEDISLPEVPAESGGEWWRAPGYSLMGLLRTGESDPPKFHSSGEKVHTLRGQRFYEKHGGSNVVGSPTASLEHEIHNYWMDWIDAEVSRYIEGSEESYARSKNFSDYSPRLFPVPARSRSRYKTITEEGHVWNIDPDAYAAALEAAVNGIEPSNGEPLYLAPAYWEDASGEKIPPYEIDSATLAEKLRVKDNLIDKNRPVLIEIAHISPFMMDGDKDGFSMTGEVEWKITGIRDELGTIHHLPYVVYEMEPTGVVGEDVWWDQLEDRDQ